MTKLGVAYFGNRFLKHASDDLAQIAECSDYVVHTVSEVDLYFHKHVLSKIFQESHKRGLEIWSDPWALGGVFGGESFSRYLLQHRNAWQVMSDGDIKPLACLNRNEFRSYVKEWILNVREMGTDVVFWDEPHMAFEVGSDLDGVFSCVCPTCEEIFRKKFGGGFPKKHNQDVHQFQRDTIKDFLEEIFEFSIQKKMRNALCIYAIKGFERYERLWDGAAQLKNLHIFGCDPYWRWRGKEDPSKYVKDYSKRVLEATNKNKIESQIWIQAMRLPAGKESEIEAACNAAVTEGIDYLAAWSFDGGELLDPVLAEKPAQVWQTVAKTFKQIKGLK